MLKTRIEDPLSLPRVFTHPRRMLKVRGRERVRVRVGNKKNRIMIIRSAREEQTMLNRIALFLRVSISKNRFTLPTLTLPSPFRRVPSCDGENLSELRKGEGNPGETILNNSTWQLKPLAALIHVTYCFGTITINRAPTAL